jgi:coproporphyrinogen III oxidase
MGYKSKTCPKCGAVHNKRGVYCSRSCGNQKKHKPETKKLIAQKQSEWMTSGDERAEAQVHSFTSLGNNKVADPVAPIVPRDAGYGRYVEDGDLWEEV